MSSPYFPGSQEPKVSIAEIIEALEEAEGNVAAAARKLEVKRAYLKARIDKEPQLILMLDDMREEIKDDAQSNMFKAVKAGDRGASQFVLSTLGRDRGFSTAVTGTGPGGEIVIQVKKFDVSDSGDGDA